MSFPKTWRRNYTQAEVRELVEGYEEHQCRKGTYGWPLALLCRLVDLDRAKARLGPKEYQAVLLVGLIGLSSEAAGRLLGVSQSTMWRRYSYGLEMLTTYMNVK